ncbi:MAG: mechanosensitive ion channel family protein [Proteobacteria bacterium]|nr:mechanosensitive ion channel family protein [Pseudomonadota bacterium]MBU1710406.1 mechanosensitive ion channel family protein [Pseudomonadota bacterium]
MFKALEAWLANQGFSETISHLSGILASCLTFIVFLLVSLWFARIFIIPIIEKIVRRSSNTWDDVLIDNKFFTRLSHFIPVVVAYLSVAPMFPDQTNTTDLVRKFCMVLFVILTIRILDALLRSTREIYSKHELSSKKSISGYLDAINIIAYLLSAIFIVSILTEKSPWGILSVIGGLTAIVLLIFKDTILGFIAGIQLSAHDMVRVGDWIEMPQFNADGDVIDVSIHTVKVRNWDKTISTIPTYALVTNSFKNWRGMSESGGRRIKRSIIIDMQSITFCTDEMLERFSKYGLIQDYIKTKQDEITAHNQGQGIDPSLLINGRRQTNIGVFRAYVIAYLKANAKIHKNMTFLVRHLQPTPEGLPMEIYVFSNDQVWANYEAIQADIFDHVLAAIGAFDLRVFQYPSGFDLRSMNLKASTTS